MKAPGAEYTESFSPVATDTSPGIIIGINFYHKE